MDNKNQETKEPVQLDKILELFSHLKKKQNITVRDDQFDFTILLDAVRQFRDSRYRFRLVDTGRFDAFELEWIMAYGADLYTSDDARSNVLEMDLIAAAARKGNGVVSLLINGEMEAGEDHPLSFDDLMNVAGTGAYLHMTNRQLKRDIRRISLLAHRCAKSGSWLVYYHHGPLENSLPELGRNAAWIHITDKSIGGEDDRPMIRDIIRSARSAGSNLVVHWEDGNKVSLLDDIVRAGAFVLFKSPLFDYRSPLKELEKGIKRKRLDFRTYYLHPSVLP